MNFKIENENKIIFATPINESCFFGYYNYSPLSKDGEKLLAHKPKFEGRMPEKNDELEIGFFDIDSGLWTKLGESKAFNWQQGAMLQWLGPDFNSKVIFNDSDGNKFISKIIDINTGEIKILPRAIYGVHPNGKIQYH
jgi:hypothetical protein